MSSFTPGSDRPDDGDGEGMPTERDWLEGLPEDQVEKCDLCHTIGAHEPGCLASDEKRVVSAFDVAESENDLVDRLAKDGEYDLPAKSAATTRSRCRSGRHIFEPFTPSDDLGAAAQRCECGKLLIDRTLGGGRVVEINGPDFVGPSRSRVGRLFA